jgi:hypothetical protein
MSQLSYARMRKKEERGEIAFLPHVRIRHLRQLRVTEIENSMIETGTSASNA